MKEQELDPAALVEAAQEAAGNWLKFESFSWNRQYDLEDPAAWTIVYTTTRDSDLATLSNAGAIEKRMAPFLEGEDPDAVTESHSHWAVGWVVGYSIRVYREEKQKRIVTEAFKEWMRIVQALNEYPLLDEMDHSEREHEATLQNVEEVGRRFLQNNPPDDWVEQLYTWLSDHKPHSLEDHDGNGGYPDKDDVKEGLSELGLLEDDDDELSA